MPCSAACGPDEYSLSPCGSVCTAVSRKCRFNQCGMELPRWSHRGPRASGSERASAGGERDCGHVDASHTHKRARAHARTRRERETAAETRTHGYSSASTQASRPTRRTTQAHTQTQAHTHERTNACTHADTPARTHARTYMRTHARTHIHAHARTHARTHLAHVRPDVERLLVVSGVALQQRQRVPALPLLEHRLEVAWQPHISSRRTAHPTARPAPSKR
jgi:hypothetical protein